MKRFLLVAAVGLPLVFLAPKWLAPRVSLAQPSLSSSASKGLPRPPWLKPLPPQMSLEDAQHDIRLNMYLRTPGERAQLIQQGFFDWRTLAHGGGDVVWHAPAQRGDFWPGGAPSRPPTSIQVHLFAHPPFDPTQLKGISLASSSYSSERPGDWEGDLKLWFRVDGADPRAVPDALSSSPTATPGSGQNREVQFWREWGLDTEEGAGSMWASGVRRDAKDVWQEMPKGHGETFHSAALSRAQLFVWGQTPWICLHVRSWGGGQWRYNLSPQLRVPTFSQEAAPGSLDRPIALFPIRLETNAPIYGNAKSSAPWPRTRLDVVSPKDPLLRSIEFLDAATIQWKTVPKRGETGFPLAVGNWKQVAFRAVPLDPKRPFPSSPLVYPRWKATRDGAVIVEGEGKEQQFISRWGGPKPNATTKSGYVSISTNLKSPEWRVRPSTNDADLMTISVSAGNTLETQVRVLPQPTPTAIPTSISGAFELQLGQGNWGAVENLEAVRPAGVSGYALWAPQKTALALPAPRFRARLWINGTPYGNIKVARGDLKVVFRSLFGDGTPCGSWNAADVSFDGGNIARAVASFQAPARIGMGRMWVEVFNRAGVSIGRSKDRGFAVLPIGLSSETTRWERDGQNDQWTRYVGILVAAQIPKAWQTGATGRVFSKAIGYIPDSELALPGVPVRLRVVPAPFIEPGAMPRSTLSVSRGQTGIASPLPTSAPGMYSGSGFLSGSAPRLVVTQTVRWKPGDSNQLDNARVVAQLDLPAPSKGKTP